MKPGITECVRCDNFFTCKGRPEGIERCINYKERTNMKNKYADQRISGKDTNESNN